MQGHGNFCPHRNDNMISLLRKKAVTSLGRYFFVVDPPRVRIVIILRNYLTLLDSPDSLVFFWCYPNVLLMENFPNSSVLIQ